MIISDCIPDTHNKMQNGQYNCMTIPLQGNIGQGSSMMGGHNNCVTKPGENCLPGFNGGMDGFGSSGRAHGISQLENAYGNFLGNHLQNTQGLISNGLNGGYNGNNGNYGIFETNSPKLPDPQMLVRMVEDATATYMQNKDFLRKVLEKLKSFLQRSSVLLAELTTDIKNSYGELKETVKKHNQETSGHIKSVLAKKMIDLRTELQNKITMFDEIRKWQMTVSCSISTTL